MRHDDKCELHTTLITPHGVRTPSCQCGSRACPLCDACRSGLHLKHRASDRDCACDLCEVAA